MVVPRLEGAPRDDVHTDAEEFLKILKQANMVQKGGTRFEIDKQIHIAAWVSLSPSDRAEHSDPMSPALERDAEDLGAATAQPFEGQHIIGHLSSLTPRGLEVASDHLAAGRSPAKASPGSISLDRPGRVEGPQFCC